MAQKKIPNSQAKMQAWMAQTSRGLMTAVMMLICLVIVGVAGYRIVEGWSLLDSFYMTIITISTVGYGEVQPLTLEGRMFSSFLIIIGMCVVAYCLNVIARSVLEGEINRLRGMSKMLRKISGFEKHYIICGYGRLAHYIIPELQDRGHQVVVIDSDPMQTIELEALEIPYLEGNAYDNDTLQAAGVERASSLMALLPDDADNVYITLSARHMNPALHIIARTESIDGGNKLRLAGANHVVAPYRVSGTRIVQHLLHPTVNDFLEITTDAHGTSLSIEKVIIPNESWLDGKTLAESEIRQKTGVLVAACINHSGEMELSPGKDSILHSGATLIALGTKEDLEKLADIV